jgi:hypothetical protein
MQLIPTWRSFWRFWSVRFTFLGGALLTLVTTFPDAALQAWLMLPQDMKQYIPVHYLQIVSVGLLMLSIVARLVKQPKVAEIHAENNPEASPIAQPNAIPLPPT